jgi:hypothetical protein
MGFFYGFIGLSSNSNKETLMVKKMCCGLSTVSYQRLSATFTTNFEVRLWLRIIQLFTSVEIFVVSLVGS